MKIEEARVFVGCPSSDYPSRSNYHYECWENLNLTPGSTKKKFYEHAHANINNIAQEALKGDYTHMMLLDDDMMFGPDILINLLKNDVDVVSGLYTGRGWPFYPMFMDKYYPERFEEVPAGSYRWGVLEGEPGLKEVEAVGNGCFLIKTDCLRKFKPGHYFREEFINKDGEYRHTGCDLLFCRDLKNFGYKIYLDTRVQIFHAIKGAVAAFYEGNSKTWMTGIRIGNGIIFTEKYTAKNDD